MWILRKAGLLPQHPAEALLSELLAHHSVLLPIDGLDRLAEAAF
jgi:hypothetical protein